MSIITLREVFSQYTENNLMPSVIFDEIIKEIDFDIQDNEEFNEALYVGFDDFDKRHDESIQQPVYLNDFDFNIQEDREAIIGLLRTEYDDNNFSTIGSCLCGKYKANMYVDSGFICNECHTHVVKPLSANFTTRVWLKRPVNVSGFINPAIYDTFFKKLTTKTPKINIVDFWINSSIRKDKKFKAVNSGSYLMAKKLNEFRESLGIDWGYNAFIDNIDKIIVSLLHNDYLRILDIKAETREHYAQFWHRYKHYAVSHYLPVPNKIMTIVESDNRNKYYTKEQIDVNTLFQTISDLYKEDDPKCKMNSDIMGRLYESLVDALAKVRNNILFGKKGAMRYSAGSGRLPFTGRTVISGESGVCRSDTVILPWQFAITCLDKHLTNWLYRRGYTPLKVKELIRNAANRVCPIIEEFVDWVETNRYGIVIAGRNPSIQYLSARALFAKFNRDVEDMSMRIPITTAKAYGADRKGLIGVKVLMH